MFTTYLFIFGSLGPRVSRLVYHKSDYIPVSAVALWLAFFFPSFGNNRGASRVSRRHDGRPALSSGHCGYRARCGHSPGFALPPTLVADRCSPCMRNRASGGSPPALRCIRARARFNHWGRRQSSRRRCTLQPRTRPSFAPPTTTPCLPNAPASSNGTTTRLSLHPRSRADRSSHASLAIRSGSLSHSSRRTGAAPWFVETAAVDATVGSGMPHLWPAHPQLLSTNACGNLGRCWKHGRSISPVYATCWC